MRNACRKIAYNKASSMEKELIASAVSEPTPTAGNLPPSEKVRGFPSTPGVYLMKDSLGRVIYVGKAKNLRNRAGHYFTSIAATETRTRDLVKEIADIDFL